MKVATIQVDLSEGDLNEKLSSVASTVMQCKGCDLVVLPEMFLSGAFSNKERMEETASFYEETEQTMLLWAKNLQALIIGSTAYKAGLELKNRLVCAFPDGRCIYYDKHHLFVPGGENKIFTPGNKRCIIEWMGMKIALFICYELRFPVWCRNKDSEYDAAIFVANWPENRRDAWQILLQARAIENQSFVIGVNCKGVDVYGSYYSGNSFAINGKGDIITQALASSIMFVELDKNDLEKKRKYFPVLLDADKFELKN